MHRSDKLISFIDLAGHEKYLKTTISGMVGLAPDHAMVTVSASPSHLAAMEGGVSVKTTTACGNVMGTSWVADPLEHLDIALALDVPLFIVLTKVRGMNVCAARVSKSALSFGGRSVFGSSCIC